jgi:alpha-galactosidase
MPPKITFVGGGSYQWGPKLLLDIADTPSLADADIVVHDIDPAPLPKMVELVERVAAERNLGLSITATTDRRAALDGADYVVVCISTGGLDSMTVDIEYPERVGLVQTVGDSVGPGGIMRALRNIPVLVEIARDMESLCPAAWMLNLTNPMTTLTRAVLGATEIEAVGLCHEVTIAQFQLSLLLDCDMRAIDMDVCGVNHLPIVTRLTIDGVDGLEVLHDKLDDLAAFGAEPLLLPSGVRADSIAGADAPTKAGLLDQHRVKLELFRRFGALPAAGDRHLVEFFPNQLTETSDWGRRWGVERTTIEQRRAWNQRQIAALDDLLAASPITSGPSGEMVASIIDAHRRDRARVVPLNLANEGQCPDVPDGAVVESMCRVDGSGVHPGHPVYAPPVLGEYLRRVSASQEMTVEAALSGDRDLVFQAMLADPLASRVDFDTLRRLTDSMIDATAQWLPQFA